VTERSVGTVDRADATPAAPPYGSGTLSDLLPDVLSCLGVRGEGSPLGLDLPTRVAVLLIDGLGAHLLAEHAKRAPCLAELAAQPGARVLAAGFPSTTATSLTSLGTGLPPGSHGVLGLTMRRPDGSLLAALHWDPAHVDPADWQPHPTAFERAAAAGLPVTSVGPSRFRGSGLNGAAFRGVTPRRADSPGELAAATLDELRIGRGPALVYTYHGDLDATGHREGCRSTAWALQLEHVDRLVEQIVTGLPAGTALVVTADHGMVDVPAEHRIDVDSVPELMAGVETLAGEPRARYVHARPGAAEDVLATWRAVLGARWGVYSRAETVAAGWFGPGVDPERLGRIGDVVAVPHDDDAIYSSSGEPIMAGLIGMHGGLSAAEQAVPLLVARG
jgi:type I phosphodiesterase/nucleotide pyrophosphatase